MKLPISGTLGLFCLLCLCAGFVVNAEPGLTSFLWNCPIKVSFDVPCFSCGITRVFMHLARGELLSALVLSPLPFLAITLSLAAGAWHLFARVTGRTLPDTVIGRWLLSSRFRMSVVLMFFGLWGYATLRSILTGAP